MQFATSGIELHVEARGDGEPLLLLHGGTGIGSDWQYVFTAGDPDGFRVIVPDLRGHGRSTNTGGRLTFQQCALDMLALLDHLGIRRVSAIGMSADAKTLLHMASCNRNASARWCWSAPRRGSRRRHARRWPK